MVCVGVAAVAATPYFFKTMKIKRKKYRRRNDCRLIVVRMVKVIEYKPHCH